jgi:hypothetical protein
MGVVRRPPDAANDDEYLSVEREQARKRTSSVQKSVLDALKPTARYSFSAKGDARPGSKIAGLYTRLSLRLHVLAIVNLPDIPKCAPPGWCMSAPLAASTLSNSVN